MAICPASRRPRLEGIAIRQIKIGKEISTIDGDSLGMVAVNERVKLLHIGEIGSVGVDLDGLAIGDEEWDENLSIFVIYLGNTAP
jgi:hypothetical protein